MYVIIINILQFCVSALLVGLSLELLNIAVNIFKFLLHTSYIIFCNSNYYKKLKNKDYYSPNNLLTLSGSRPSFLLFCSLR